MPKIFLLSWIIVLTYPQAGGQAVKDTVRSKIDYRLYQPFNTRAKVNTVQESVSKKNERKAISASSQKDTVRSRINYRKTNTHQAAKRARPQYNYSHHLGFQFNHALRLLPNINDGSTLLSNPYGFAYSIVKNRSGYGLSFGIGYGSTYDKTKTSLTTTLESAQGKTSIRVGTFKQKTIGTRVKGGIGLDFIHSQEIDVTRNFLNGFVDEKTEKTKGFGFGPRAMIQYECWGIVWIGTETGLYFENLNATTKEKFTGLPTDYSRSTSRRTTFLPPVSVLIVVQIR